MAGTTDSGVMKISPVQAKDCIKAAYAMRRPMMLWGPPGTAKSAIMRQSADELGIGFIDLRLVQIDAVDLRGMPYKDERDGKIVMGFAPSSILPRSGAGILFLDELPQAPTLVQNSASELLLDRRVGEYELPEGWAPMCAGNRRTDRAGTLEVPSHLKNRLIHVEMKSTLKDWLDWAVTKGINPHVMAFLKANPKHLYAFDADHLAFPTLRTWEFVSDVLNARLTDSKTRDALIYGCVGEAVGTEVCVFLEQTLELPAYKDVVANPKGIPLPTKPNLLLQMMGMVAGTAKVEDLPALLVFFDRLAGDEVWFAMTQMGEREPKFLKEAKFVEMLEKFSGKDKGSPAK